MIGKSENDAVLLDRFARERDEAAFVALMERHGPRVMHACRQVLPCEHDAEEVVQATFLVLAKKAGEVRWEDSVGCWLTAAARRLALKARSRSVRGKLRESSLAEAAGRQERTQGDPRDEADRREVRHAVHEALRQLPEKYRAPVLLCYYEGKSSAEAARELGWPAGSMSRRLERARALLRRKLFQAGLVGVLVAAGVLLLQADRSGRADIGRHGRLAQRPVPAHGLALPSLVLADGDSRPLAWSLAEGEQAEALVRKMGEAAVSLFDHDPNRERGLWRFQAARMRLAALDLGRAARNDDPLALRGAVRQLESACTQCHEHFRR